MTRREPSKVARTRGPLKITRLTAKGETVEIIDRKTAHQAAVDTVAETHLAAGRHERDT